ncbi:MAG TPA: phytanoyl-CoA dioxygenase family protein, partial [Coleofasciculaceae cyanobacterium]
IDNPRISPYLLDLLGPKFRLDHDYIHIIHQGPGPIGSDLHGGGTPYDPCQYYQYKNGRMYNGLTAVAYNLTDVNPGEGGFGCIPGSHKSNLPLPAELQDLEHPHACVQEIGGKAGTAIIFTEALTHGTLVWKGQRDRRTLFYKYSPYPSAWLRNYYNPDDYPDLTEAQRDILRTPGVYP